MVVFVLNKILIPDPITFPDWENAEWLPDSRTDKQMVLYAILNRV